MWIFIIKPVSRHPFKFGNITASFLVLEMSHSLLCCPARMHRKNGQFASLKENPGGSSWDSSQSCVQDGTPCSETVWVKNIIWVWDSLFKNVDDNDLFLQCFLVSGDVSTVVLVKIILQQCVVGQLDLGLYVMLVDLCGQIRFVCVKLHF